MTISISDWSTAEISAVCSGEDCDWSAGEEVLLNAYEKASQHATETGHDVIVKMTSVRTVKHP